MRFRCEKKTLAEALRLAHAATSKRQLPELRQVLLRVEAGRVEACGTDGLNALTVELVGAEALDDGQTLVPGEHLIQVVEEWDPEVWELEGEGADCRVADAWGKPVIEYGATRKEWYWTTSGGEKTRSSRLVTIRPDGYPAELTRLGLDEPTCRVAAEDLARGLTRCLPCRADHFGARFHTTGVLLSVGENRLDLYCTDEKRIATHRIDTLYGGPAVSAQIEDGFAEDIVRACEAHGSADHPAELRIEARRVSVRVGPCRLAGPVVEGCFPPCEQILGLAAKCERTTVKLAELKRIIRMAAVARPESAREGCNVWLALGDGLVARARDFGYAEARASSASRVEAVEVPYDLRFLQKILLPLEGDTVELGIEPKREMLTVVLGPTRFLLAAIVPVEGTEPPRPTPDETKPAKRSRKGAAA